MIWDISTFDSMQSVPWPACTPARKEANPSPSLSSSPYYRSFWRLSPKHTTGEDSTSQPLFEPCTCIREVQLQLGFDKRIHILQELDGNCWYGGFHLYHITQHIHGIFGCAVFGFWDPTNIMYVENSLRFRIHSEHYCICGCLLGNSTSFSHGNSK